LPKSKNNFRILTLKEGFISFEIKTTNHPSVLQDTLPVL